LPKETAAVKIRKALKEFQEAASASPRVPPSHGRINETPLRAEVQPGSQVIDLEVK
jgi:hypothetical protein